MALLEFGLSARFLLFVLLSGLVPLLAIGLGLAIFFLGRRYVQNKYGKR